MSYESFELKEKYVQNINRYRALYNQIIKLAKTYYIHKKVTYSIYRAVVVS